MIRQENLGKLIEESGGDEHLAERYGCTASYIRQMRLGSVDSDTGKPKGIGNRTARKLEKCMGKPQGWLDQDHSRQNDLPPEFASLIDTIIKAASSGTMSREQAVLHDQMIKANTGIK